MTTKLEKDLKREITLDGEPYTVTLSPNGLKITQKGKRKGIELTWKNLVNDQAAQSTELDASLEAAND